MTSEKRRLIGEVAPCPPPTTSSTLLLLLFPLVPAPLPTPLFPVREKSGSWTRGLSVRPLATLKGEWVADLIRAGWRGDGGQNFYLHWSPARFQHATLLRLRTCQQRRSECEVGGASEVESSSWRLLFLLLASCDCLWFRSACLSACLPVLWTCQLPCSGGSGAFHTTRPASLLARHTSVPIGNVRWGPKLHDWPSDCRATTTKHTQSRCPP